MITFANFAEATKDLGTAVEQSKSVYFIKAGKAGHVEFHSKDNYFVAGARAGKNTASVTQAAKEAGFKVLRERKGWTVFEGGSLDEYRKFFGAVSSASVSTKTVKMSDVVKRVGKAFAEKKTAKAAVDSGLIKAKNLDTIKSVAAKRAAALVA